MLSDFVPHVEFFVISIGLFVGCAWILKRVASRAWKFISFGVLVAVAAIGFDLLLPSASKHLPEILMKIGFIIVLCGVGVALLGQSRHSPY